MKKVKGKKPKGIMWNRKTDHPSIIVEEKSTTKKSVGITHAKETNEAKNHRLRKNPNPKPKRPNQYVVGEIQEQKKRSYKPMHENVKLSPKDEIKVKHFIKKLERKEIKRQKKLQIRNKKKSD